jgi:hypothetical protein
MQHPGLKLSLVFLAALSTLSGCVDEARPVAPRTVYVEPTCTVVVESGRTVVGDPVRPAGVRAD